MGKRCRHLLNAFAAVMLLVLAAAVLVACGGQKVPAGSGTIVIPGATSPTEGDAKTASMFRLEPEGNGYTITKYLYDDAELTIPASYAQKPILSIGPSAFADCSTLTAVTVPEGVVAIGENAFARCSSLSAVTLPSGLESIGAYAFAGCGAIVKADYQGTLADWCGIDFGGEQANPIEYANSRTFGQARIYVKNTDADLPVQQVIAGNVDIPAGTPAVADYAFACAIDIKEVTIGEGATRIGAYAFKNCTNLTSITFPEGVAEIGDYAFEGCTALPSASIASGLTTIGAAAFKDCINLSSIELPSTLDSVGLHAFYGCEKLKKVNFLGELNDWSDVLFHGYASNPLQLAAGSVKLLANGNEVKGRVEIPSGASRVGDYAFFGLSDVTEVVIPEGVTEIGMRAFEGCTSLDTISIPNSAVTIDDSAFTSCGKFKKASLPVSAMDKIPVDDITDLTIAGGVPTREIMAKFGKTVVLTLAPEVVKIGALAFEDCASLAEIDYQGDFESWLAIDFEEGVTPEKIKNNLYISNKRAVFPTVITLSENAQKIGNYAFFGVTDLTEVHFPGTLTSVGDYAFCGCTSLSVIEFAPLPQPETPPQQNDDEQGEGSQTETSQPKAAAVCAIGQYAFEGCAAIETLTFSDAVASVGSFAFAHCAGLASVTFDQSVKRVGDNAFENCAKLQLLDFNGGAEEIGSNAFDGCEALKALDFGESVTTIRSHAFANCTGLVSIVIPETVTSLHSTAFSGCLRLVHIDNRTKSTISSPATFGGEVQQKETQFQNTLERKSNGVWTYLVAPPAEESSGDAQTADDKAPQAPELYAISYDGDATALDLSVADITTIYPNAFKGLAQLTSVQFPASLKVIGDSAFEGTSLNAVSLPAALKSIGNHAFESTLLSSLTIPAECATIGQYAFASCDQLASLTLEKGVKTIGDHAFDGAQIGALAIPEDCETIGAYAFAGCAALSSLTFGAGVKSVGDHAFDGCKLLAEVVLPASVTKIGSDAFASCGVLVHITDPSKTGLTSPAHSEGEVSESADQFKNTLKKEDNGVWTYTVGETVYAIRYDGASDVLDLTGSTVTAIYPHAFEGNASLRSVVLPASVTAIEEFAFSGCVNLETLALAEGLTKIGQNAFGGCESLAEVNIPSTAEIGESAFEGCAGLTTLTIAEGVTTIGTKAFKDCASLSSLTIPAKAETIGESAFEGCSALETLTVAEIKKISSNAFKGCVFLSSATLPEGIEEIGEGAFEGCAALISLQLNAKMISARAFADCSSLRDVTLTGGESIGESAFANCGKLRSLTIPETVTSIAKTAFENCFKLVQVKNLSATTVSSMIKAPYAEIIKADEEFKNVLKLESNGVWTYKVEKKVYAFDIEADVTSVNLNGVVGLTDIYPHAFEGAALNSVIVKKGVEVSDYAFANCAALTQITLPEELTSIGAHAFDGCQNLAAISLPSTVTAIGDHAFANCAALAQITLPTELTAINAHTFEGCAALGIIFLPAKLTSIGVGAFGGCIGLSTVYFFGEPAQWQTIAIAADNLALTHVDLYYFSADNPYTEGTQAGDETYWYMDGNNAPQLWEKPEPAPEPEPEPSPAPDPDPNPDPTPDPNPDPSPSETEQLAQ